MNFSPILQRFVQNRPLAVVTQVVLENFFGNAQLDGIFAEVAQNQHTRELLFSTTTNLLVEVTLFGQSSVCAAFKKDREQIPVSLAAVYNKLQGVEPAVCEALVQRTADQAGQLLNMFQQQRPQPIAGYRLKIADGNVLGRTQHRLKELRGSSTAALPGLSMALYDYASQLITRLKVCEDAHTNERNLMPALLPHLEKGDLLLADRNFAMRDFFQALQQRQVGFVIRHHASLKLEFLGERRPAARCQTGKTAYQQVRLSDGQEYMAIIVERDQPLKKGGQTVILLTNLPVGKSLARKLANLYLQRWKIEEAFRQLTQYLSCEVNTLGYPKAALLAFSLAVLAYNCLACVKGALASRFGHPKIDQELSMFYVAAEVKLASDGLRVAVADAEWQPFRTMSIPELAQVLRQLVDSVTWQRYTKSPRGPKKPGSRHRKRHVHKATAKIIAARKQLAERT